MHQQRVAVENSPALKALCIRTRRSSNPCRAHCQFCIPPAMPCISVPCPCEREYPLKAGRASLLHTPVLVSRRSRHHKIRKKHAMFLSRSLIQMPANEHCHSYEAHVSSPARQSRFCRRSHPLYQPYRVCRRGPIAFSRVDGGWRCMHA